MYISFLTTSPKPSFTQISFPLKCKNILPIKWQKAHFPPQMAMMKISASFPPCDGRPWIDETITVYVDDKIIVILTPPPSLQITRHHLHPPPRSVLPLKIKMSSLQALLP